MKGRLTLVARPRLRKGIMVSLSVVAIAFGFFP